MALFCNRRKNFLEALVGKGFVPSILRVAGVIEVAEVVGSKRVRSCIFAIFRAAGVAGLVKGEGVRSFDFVDRRVGS